MTDWIQQIKDMPPVERLRYLEDNADDLKDGIYYHDFSEEELEDLRTANAQTDIDIRRNEEELARVAEPLKERLKELRAAKKHTVTQLKEGREEVDGTLYIFHDTEGRTTYELDADGNIINQRSLAKRQSTIYQAGRKAEGTNG